MMAIVAVLLCLQQDQTVARNDPAKADYFAAIAKCKEGQQILATDPRGAIERFTEVLANEKLKLIECRLRITEAPGEYTAWVAFLPYQYRGQARLALAKSDAVNALKLLDGAVEDFQKSFELGVAPSEKLLKDAKSERDRVKAAAAAAAPAPRPAEPAPRDPEPDFRSAWSDLLRQRRFREARTHIEKNGTFLDEKRRRPYVDQTDDDCRKHVGELLDRYARNLATASPASLARMTPREIESDFALPDPKENCVKMDALDWAISFRAVLEKLGRREEGLDALLEQAAAAATVEGGDGRRWFRGAAELAFGVLEPKVRSCADRSRAAAAAERDRLKTEATALKQRWGALASGLPKDFRDRNPFLEDRARALEDLIGQFPIDVDDVAKAAQRLDQSFEQEKPEVELEKIEKDLGRIHAEQGSKISVESKRDLLTYLLVAASLRQFLAGKSVEEVAATADLQAHGKSLAAVGGPVDVKRFGGKVSRVLAKLCP